MMRATGILCLIMVAVAAPQAGARGKAAAVPDAAAIDPARSQELYLGVIRKLHQDSKSHAALAYLDDFDRRYPGDAKARLLRANCLTHVGELAEAEQIYRGLVTGPEQAAAEAGLGQVAAARGDWPGAAAAYGRAVGANPVDASYRSDLGYALLKTGNRARALFVLRQATELAPGSAVIRNNLLLALAASGNRAETASLLNGIADEGERHSVGALVAREAGGSRP